MEQRTSPEFGDVLGKGKMKVSEMHSTTRPRFNKMRRDFSKSFIVDVKDTINAYWGMNIARIGNDNNIHTFGGLVNGVPYAACDPDANYTHKDIVWVRREGKSLHLTRQT